MLSLMPHGSCFLWNKPLTLLHVASDSLIAIAYFSIPLMLFLNRHHATPVARPLLILFATFILSCGLVHSTQVWNIWHANYWTEGLQKVVTAIASCYTAITLRRELPKMLNTQTRLEETEKIARADALTGLLNRRGLEYPMQEAIDRFQRTQFPASLLLLDLDGFKAINDHFGHPTGDQILKQVGKILNSYTRSQDYVARLGGDEFAVLLMGCGSAEAEKVAEKLRQAVLNLATPERFPAGRPLTDADEIVIAALTVSIGLVTVQEHTQPETLYERADVALYKAKHQGKNQIQAAI